MDNDNKDIKNELDSFLNNENIIDEVNEKETVIMERTGLVEKINKVFITQDGRMLLREELYK